MILSCANHHSHTKYKQVHKWQKITLTNRLAKCFKLLTGIVKLEQFINGSTLASHLPHQLQDPLSCC